MCLSNEKQDIFTIPQIYHQEQIKNGGKIVVQLIV